MKDADKNHSHSQAGDAAAPWLQFWTSFAQQAQGAPISNLADATAMRRAWLQAATASTDTYLRSPLFLQMLKQQVDGLAAGHGSSGTAAASTGASSPPEQAAQQQARSLWQSLFDAQKNATATPQQRRGTTPCEVIYEDGPLKLVRYCRRQAVAYAEPLLICYALVNRPYILDLQAQRSVVRRLLDDGHDVFLIDWGMPSEADQSKRLEDYVCRQMRDVIDIVCAKTRSEQLNLLGYCMGGTMSAMHTALQPDKIRNLILLATPIDFGGQEALLNLWSDPKYFDVDGLIDAMGNCPGPLLQFCFQLTKPVQNFQEKYLTLLDKLDDEDFTHSFEAMEQWSNDSIPVAGETFREFVKSLYQQNLLVQGKMELGGEIVDLAKITSPLLLLTADYDHLTPPASTLVLAEYVGSRDITKLSCAVGHVGLAVSRKAHRDLWPAAAEWIGEHSTRAG